MSRIIVCDRCTRRSTAEMPMAFKDCSREQEHAIFEGLELQTPGDICHQCWAELRSTVLNWMRGRQ